MMEDQLSRGGLMGELDGQVLREDISLADYRLTRGEGKAMLDVITGETGNEERSVRRRKGCDMERRT